MKSLFTIGHSTHELEYFIELLERHGIDVVADVRSAPYSRYNPQFNRETLKEALRERPIAYVFLGRELGARSEDPACYIDGRIQYDRLAKTELFQEGMNRLEKGIESHRVTMMCAEKDPLTCHRAILVSRHAEDRGIRVVHIREDGQLETHQEAMMRLLDELRMPPQDLFRGPDEIMIEAYGRRAAAISFSASSNDEEGSNNP